MTDPEVLHLSGPKRIYGNAPWTIDVVLGRWVDDAELEAGSYVLESALANFGPGDVGAEILVVDPDLPIGENELDFVPSGTTIEAVIDESHATLSDPSTATDSAVVLIFGSDITGKTYTGAIKAKAKDGAALEVIDVDVVSPANKGRIRLSLTEDQVEHLAARIGTPRPATARGTYDVVEVDGPPVLTGAVVVELPVSA